MKPRQSVGVGPPLRTVHVLYRKVCTRCGRADLDWPEIRDGECSATLIGGEHGG